MTCRLHPQGHTDDAKRCADNVNLHYQAIGWDAIGKWVAIKLADGGSDSVLYDTKRDAVRHQSDEFLCCYVKLIPHAMTVCEAQTFMKVHRKAYDAGWRHADPDARHGGKQLIRQMRNEDIARQIRAMQRVISGGN
jgi:hypothetical protein